MQNKVCIAELGAHCWSDIERNVDNLYSWLINYLFLDSISSQNCLSRSPTTRFSSRPLAWRQLQDRLEAFRQNHISDDLDFGLEQNLDRNDPTV